MKCSHDPRFSQNRKGETYNCPGCDLLVIADIKHPEICDCHGFIDYKTFCSKCSPNNFDELIRTAKAYDGI